MLLYTSTIRFDFSKYIFFYIHIDYTYVYIHNKSYVYRKAKINVFWDGWSILLHQPPSFALEISGLGKKENRLSSVRPTSKRSIAHRYSPPSIFPHPPPLRRCPTRHRSCPGTQPTAPLPPSSPPPRLPPQQARLVAVGPPSKVGGE